MMALEEKCFIREGSGDNSYPFRFWSILVTFTMLLIYAGAYKANGLLSDQLHHHSFLNVSNRQFSLFLWQYPHYMRVHAKNKIGYLTGFQYLHKVNMELEFSEESVVAPPDILFHYHVWKRLLQSYLPVREISVIEFKEFLSALEEWQPTNWSVASKEYIKLVEGLNSAEKRHLETELPFEVRQAFYGWKNYFKEGEAINAFNPTYFEVEEFLKSYPQYARNYWQNMYPDYLKSLSQTGYESRAKVPNEEITPFLRVAIFNFVKGLANVPTCCPSSRKVTLFYLNCLEITTLKLSQIHQGT